MTINLSDKQLKAFDLICKGYNVFLTGPAGSGKSFLLKYFIEWYIKNKEKEESRIYITSTTGLSALLIDGITINRYSGIGIGDKTVEEYYKKINKHVHIKRRWLNTGVLIIDEISMMNPETFDKLEILAKKIRKNNDPFGGIQIILSGDFLQLPPVNSKSFCFESFVWDTVISHTIYFDKILRQDDLKMQDVLNNIRIGIVNEDVRNILNSCLNKNLSNKDGIVPTLLYSKKNMVTDYNISELNKLIDNGYHSFTYTSDYEFNKSIPKDLISFYKEMLNSQYQIEDNLKFALHSQVMLIVNMPDYKLANGSRGIITGFTDETYPIVRFLDGISLDIRPYNFSIEENGHLITKIQIPLIYSWAITIHKAQGMTLEFLKTDIGSSIFEYGQAYVVLSRIKNIEGLSLINIDYSKIKAHPKILKYYEKLIRHNLSD